ncbi:MAG: hypothetical protein EDX89_09260 [Acidobacteria bacterium]|nr:MAG: hypothetical protein EDX89_09260 [Acidobacteriota bacterium]
MIAGGRSEGRGTDGPTPLSRVRLLATLVALAAAAAPAFGQEALLVAPQTLLVPNDDSLPIGTWAAFEANAAVVRADDSSAVWFNPAGLARAESSSAAASASTIVQTKVESDAFASDVSGSQLTPSQFAAVLTSLREKTGLTLGFGVTRLVSWDVRADGLVFQDVPSGRRRLTFNESGSYTRTSYAAAAALGISPALRGGLAVSVETVETTAFVAGTDGVAGTEPKVFTFREDAEDETLLLRATLGVQADLGRGWGAGAVLRSPGLALSSSGRYSGDFTYADGGTTTNVAFFDDDADGGARMPFEVVLGAAYGAKRFSVEAKARYIGASGAHDLFATSLPGTATVTRPGTAPVTFPVAVPATTTSRRAVTDFALGGHVDLGASGKVRLHAGVGTSSSPVPADDPVYTRADLWGATLGLSTRISSLRLSAGLRYERGTVDDIRTEVLPVGEVVRSGATIRNLGVVFAFAYDAGGATK